MTDDNIVPGPGMVHLDTGTPIIFAPADGEAKTSNYEAALFAAESIAVATWDAGEGLNPHNRLRTALDEYRAALESAGLLTRPEFFSRWQIEQFAKVLALRSDHPLYTTGAGWRLLMQSMSKMEHAAKEANRRINMIGGSEIARRDVDAAHTALEAYIRANGGAP